MIGKSVQSAGLAKELIIQDVNRAKILDGNLFEDNYRLKTLRKDSEYEW